MSGPAGSLLRPATGPSRLLRRIAGEHAAERTYRVLAFAFLPGGVVFGLLAAPAALTERHHIPLWWTITAYLVGVGPSVLLGATAFALPLGALRRIARLGVAGTLLVLASVPAVAAPPGASADPVWFDGVCGLGLVSAALAFRPGWAVGAAALGGALDGEARAAVTGLDPEVVGTQNGLYVLLFTVTFVALGARSLAAARAADEAEAEAEAATAAAAADAAREREQARIDALVHDRVLATLLTTARQIPGSAALERRDAARALEGLRALLDEEAPLLDVPGERFAFQIQAITTELLPEALFNYALDAEEDVPGPVAAALAEAAEEAMRNSLRHAGAANRTVHVRVGRDGAEVDVLDDGVGFERADVPMSRLGVVDSIEGRMRAVPGGSAAVVSQRGVGTRVALRWRRR